MEVILVLKLKILTYSFCSKTLSRHGNEVICDIGKDVGRVLVSVSRVQL